jgi:hypothetical protein
VWCGVAWRAVVLSVCGRPCGWEGGRGMGPSVAVAPRGRGPVCVDTSGIRRWLSRSHERRSGLGFVLASSVGMRRGEGGTRRGRVVPYPLLPCPSFSNPIQYWEATVRVLAIEPKHWTTYQRINIDHVSTYPPNKPLAAPPPTPPPPPTLESSTTRHATTNPTPTRAAE